MFHPHDLTKLPNLLSLGRIFLTITAGILIWQDFYVAAFVLCLCAALSDYYDGKLARLRNECTSIGEKLDPVADKVFEIWILYALGVPVWLILTMVTRNLWVTVLFRSGDMHMKVSMFAKYKTALLYVLVLITIAVKIVYPEINLWAFSLKEWYAVSFTHVILVLTVATGAQYTIRAFFPKTPRS